jgi:hypothetical protein
MNSGFNSNNAVNQRCFWRRTTWKNDFLDHDGQLCSAAAGFFNGTVTACCILLQPEYSDYHERKNNNRR